MDHQLEDPAPQEAGRLVELYEAAKDENELLEFKNYELMFKIQELEQNQREILSKLSSDDQPSTTSADNYNKVSLLCIHPAGKD